MRRLTFLVFALAFSACQGSRDYADSMRHEHDGETPTASGAVSAADTLGATTERVVYATVGGKEVTGVLARPVGASPEADLPGVIVIHEWWGLNENVEQMTQKIAALGYAALAVDLYNGTVATTPDRAMSTMRAAMADSVAITENLRAAYAYLTEQQGAPRVGSLGWCFGGGMSLRTALALPTDLDAAVIYYGTPVADVARLRTLQMPILGLFGAEDGGIPVASVDAFREALDEAGVTNEIVIYPGAAHAFANPSGQRYEPSAAEDAWRRVRSFLADNVMR